MRAVKRTVSVLLSLMLVLGMVTMGISVASAATPKTVTVTSNIGANGSIQYTPGVTQQVTVTFKLKTTSYRVISTQGVITFDPTVLKVASSNTAATFAPIMKDGLQVNLNKTDGRIPFNASNPNTYNYRNTVRTYVSVVFDVIGTGDTTVNLDVSNLTVTKQYSGAAESSDKDLDVIDTAHDVNRTTAYEGSLELAVAPEVSYSINDFLKNKALNYQGKVGLRFKFVIPEAAQGQTVKAVISSDFSNEVINVPFDNTTYSSSEKKYISPDYQIRSIDAASPVHITVYVNDVQVATTDYCARDYAKAIIASTSSSVTAKDKTLAKAYTYYASRAQLAFNHNTGDLANDGISYTPPTVTADTITNTIYKCPDLSAYGLGANTNALILDADTSIRSSFAISNETTLKASTVKVNGTKTDYTKSSGKAMYFMEGIASNALGKLQKISFAKSGSTAYFNINAYYVARKMIESSATTAAQKELARALYTYGEASVDRFGAAS